MLRLPFLSVYGIVYKTQRTSTSTSTSRVRILIGDVSGIKATNNAAKVNMETHKVES